MAAATVIDDLVNFPLPYGLIGFVSTFITFFSTISIVNGFSPLRVGAKIQYRWWSKSILFVATLLSTGIAFAGGLLAHNWTLRMLIFSNMVVVLLSNSLVLVDKTEKLKPAKAKDDGNNDPPCDDATQTDQTSSVSDNTTVEDTREEGKETSDKSSLWSSSECEEKCDHSQDLETPNSHKTPDDVSDDAKTDDSKPAKPQSPDDSSNDSDGKSSVSKDARGAAMGLALIGGPSLTIELYASTKIILEAPGSELTALKEVVLVFGYVLIIPVLMIVLRILWPARTTPPLSRLQINTLTVNIAIACICFMWQVTVWYRMFVIAAATGNYTGIRGWDDIPSILSWVYLISCRLPLLVF